MGNCCEPAKAEFKPDPEIVTGTIIYQGRDIRKFKALYIDFRDQDQDGHFPFTLYLDTQGVGGHQRGMLKGKAMRTDVLEDIHMIRAAYSKYIHRETYPFMCPIVNEAGDIECYSIYAMIASSDDGILAVFDSKLQYEK